MVQKILEEYDANLPTLSKLIIALSKGTFFKQSHQQIGTLGSEFTFDTNEVLVRKIPTDGSKAITYVRVTESGIAPLGTSLKISRASW